MTSEQFQRWLDFATRMAKTCHKFNPRVRRLVVDFIEDYRDRADHVNGWDGEGRYDGHGGGEPQAVFVCDDISTYLWDRGLEKDGPNGEDIPVKTGIDIKCCVRAALDMAVKPSAGVVGYTVGDLRRMYPEGLPDWLFDAFGPKAKRALKRAKDDDSVWL